MNGIPVKLGFYIDLMGFILIYCDFIVIQWDLMGYTLWKNIQKTMETSTML